MISEGGKLRVPERRENEQQEAVLINGIVHTKDEHRIESEVGGIQSLFFLQRQNGLRHELLAQVERVQTCVTFLSQSW